jgi:hypothetical protein
VVADRDDAVEARTARGGPSWQRRSQNGWLAGVLVTTVLLSLLVLSPLGLAMFAHQIRADWTTIGNIGEAYGAASAIISGVAVVGVALSLYMQAHQNQLQQFQCVRAQQLELMKLLMDDPALLAVSLTADGMSRDRWRQGIYIYLMFKHLEMQYVTGYAPGDAISRYAAEYFEIGFVRDWWRDTRDAYARDASSRHRRAFHRIVDAEFRRSTLEWLESDPQYMGGDRWRRWRRPSRRAALTAAAVTAVPVIVCGVALLSRKRRVSWLGRRGPAVVGLRSRLRPSSRP